MHVKILHITATDVIKQSRRIAPGYIACNVGLHSLRIRSGRCLVKTRYLLPLRFSMYMIVHRPPIEQPGDVWNTYWSELDWYRRRAQERRERTHFDGCIPGDYCSSMALADHVNLLPHHRDAHFSPIGYARPLFAQNSLLQLSMRIVRQQPVAFVRRRYWLFWHFREFEDAQQYLLDNLNMPKGISYWALPPLNFL